MTTGHPSIHSPVGLEEAGSGGRRDLRRIRPAAALAELIEHFLAGPPAEVTDVVNRVYSLGQAAASALLDAGDLRAWELTTRIVSEVTALARIGWIPPAT